MRSRNKFEANIDSSYRDNNGYMQYNHADEEELQTLILEVLLDIRDLLRRLYV